MISKELVQCAEDMRQVAQCGKMTLDAQARAYDLLEKIEELRDSLAALCSSMGPAEEFCGEYLCLAEVLSPAYDEEALKQEACERLKQFESALNDASAQVSKMTELHQCAKDTWEIWQNGGFIARQNALRKLRKLAGFRLESTRIGNYVAKTFDLMNEAQASCARAQQALFSANVSYKIKPDLYRKIAAALRKM